MARFQAYQQKHPVNVGHGDTEEWVADLRPMRAPFYAESAEQALKIASRWTEFLKGRLLGRYPMIAQVAA